MKLVSQAMLLETLDASAWTYCWYLPNQRGKHIIIFNHENYIAFVLNTINKTSLTLETQNLKGFFFSFTCFYCMQSQINNKYIFFCAYEPKIRFLFASPFNRSQQNYETNRASLYHLEMLNLFWSLSLVKFLWTIKTTTHLIN
jgi:hypothetical protein